jgi:hypothetical protein
VALVMVVRAVGAGEVRAALERSARWLPLAIVLEATRVLFELLATRRALGLQGDPMPPLPALIRTHLVFYAMSVGVPGGRPMAEAGKAANLSPWLGAARAAALSTATQSMAFTTDAGFAVLCMFGALKLSGFSLLTLALSLLALGCLSLASVVRRASRSPRWESSLGRFPRLRETLSRYREAAERQQMLSWDVVLILSLSRLAQVAVFGVLFFAALGITSLSHAFVGLSLSMLGSAAGDMIPGQLGGHRYDVCARGNVARSERGQSGDGGRGIPRGAAHGSRAGPGLGRELL